jgi:predicted ATPase
MKTLRKVKIEGFKSIERAELELGDLNVVIGANGSGKSNLIGVFRLLERVLSRNLQHHIAKVESSDRFLFHGRRTTPVLSLDFAFEPGFELGQFLLYYGLKLEAVDDEKLIFQMEQLGFNNGIEYISAIHHQNHKESVLEGIAKEELQSPWKIPDAKIGHLKKIGYPFASYKEICQDVLSRINTLAVYHFDDTSDSSPAKKTANLDDNRFLRADVANLPAYLYWLQEKYPVQFRHIEEHVRLVAPFFDKFMLAPRRLNEKTIKLEWRQKGSDAYFDAWSLSDGTLRFICLATLLLQPEPPKLILLDEPELGLHPYAIRILSEMVEAASMRSQVLLATQSVTLLDNFAPKDVIVVENDGRKTTFNRLDEEKLKVWLHDFSIGELWEKNVLGGNP